MVGWVLVGLAGVGVIISNIYWYVRAKEAEDDAAENLKWLRFWQQNSVELSEQLKATRDPQPETGNEDDTVQVKVYANDQSPGPRNNAQRFNFANEAFYFAWLAWNTRHD